ncbi:hypothetical protein GF406_10955, partial [candidate division KSB1 bacterium]|nr:hypothetical protein [candidate division KSB1 bacterium]
RSTVNDNQAANLRFTGKELDKESHIGLYYFGARYYDPEVGRFIGVDPLAEKFPSNSPYVYALNSPLIYFDDDGRRPWLSHERDELINAIRNADQQYFTAWGQGLRLNDQNRPANGVWPASLDVPIENIYSFDEMKLAHKTKALTLCFKEYLRLLNPLSDADPEMNRISGEDPTFGGKIEFEIPNWDSETTITNLIIGDRGGENVLLYYVATGPDGKIIHLVKRTFTRDEYNKWRQEYGKIRDKVRNGNEKDDED